MKKITLFAFLLFTFQIHAQLNNTGFETGDFTGWSGSKGDNTVSSYIPLQNNTLGFFTIGVDATLDDDLARHTILTSATGNDPVGGFPVVPPGFGNYTVRLGNNLGNYEGETIEQTFVVSAVQPYIIINYAVVSNDGTHLPGESAYFTYDLKDLSNNSLASRFDELGASPPSGYLTGANNALYLPWQSDSVSLVGYIGQTLTLRFVTAGCIHGDHYAYSYIDVFDPTSLQSVDETNTSSFHLFPNPGNGIFNILLNESSSEKENILVTNTLGQIINPPMIKTAQGWQIDMSAENPGMYFISVSTASGTSTQRLIVQ